jgi:hypothetical protein
MRGVPLEWSPICHQLQIPILQDKPKSEAHCVPLQQTCPFPPHVSPAQFED